MRIEIRFRGLQDTAELRTRGQDQLRFHLSRFSDAVEEVVLRVSDLNGPKGGLDKRCQVTTRLKNVGRVTLTVNGADARSAIDLAAERTARLVARELGRARGFRAAS